MDNIIPTCRLLMVLLYILTKLWTIFLPRTTLDVLHFQPSVTAENKKEAQSSASRSKLSGIQYILNLLDRCRYNIGITVNVQRVYKSYVHVYIDLNIDSSTSSETYRSI